MIDKAFLPIIGLNYLKIFPWHRANIINLFYNQYVKLPFIIFKMFNVLAMILSFGLFLVNIKFIVHHMLKHIKPGSEKDK